MRKVIKYLDLKNDRSFRRFFSTHKLVLFSLLKSFLPLSTELLNWYTANYNRLNTTINITGQYDLSDDLLYLNNSILTPDTPEGWQAMLDLYVMLRSGELINVEMQNYAEKNFGDRIFAYLVQLCSRQFKRGQRPVQAKPCYSLAFTKTSVSSEAHHISYATLNWNNLEDERLTNKAMVVAAQLNKFNKRIDELVDMPDRWCYHQTLGAVND